MIVRIVRMHFREEEVETFLEIFNSNKGAIRDFQGCTHLELLKDEKLPNTYTTLSHWNTVADLDAYRHSQLFESVWIRVKKLFSGRTETLTLVKYIEVKSPS